MPTEHGVVVDAGADPVAAASSTPTRVSVNDDDRDDPALLQCPPTPPLLPREPTPERIKLSPPPGCASGNSAEAAAGGRASPDHQCPICLARLDNTSFTNGCMHKFCFTCIREWAKVRAVCPLCKSSFSSIIHSVRSERDYKRYQLPPEWDPHTASGAVGTGAFSGSGVGLASIAGGYVLQPSGMLMSVPAPSHWTRRHHERIRSLVSPMLWPPSASATSSFSASLPSSSVDDVFDYRLPSAAMTLPVPPPQPAARGVVRRTRVTWRHRRQVYLDDMWARPSADELTGRYRETGPEFYRANPACTHRLVPWLNRELQAVCVPRTTTITAATARYVDSDDDTDSHAASRLLDVILASISRVHILSSRLRRRLAPALHVWTEHFVHELYTYARSPYDMVGYDLNVRYERGRPLHTFSTVVLDDGSSGSSEIASAAASAVASAEDVQDDDDDDEDTPLVVDDVETADVHGAGGGHTVSDDSDVQVISPSNRADTNVPWWAAAAAEHSGARGDDAASAGSSRALETTLDQVRSFLRAVAAVPAPTSVPCPSTGAAAAAAGARRMHATRSEAAFQRATLQVDVDSDADVQVVDVLPPKPQRAPLVNLLTSDSAASITDDDDDDAGAAVSQASNVACSSRAAERQKRRRSRRRRSTPGRVSKRRAARMTPTDNEEEDQNREEDAVSLDERPAKHCRRDVRRLRQRRRRQRGESRSGRDEEDHGNERRTACRRSCAAASRVHHDDDQVLHSRSEGEAGGEAVAAAVGGSCRVYRQHGGRRLRPRRCCSERSVHSDNDEYQQQQQQQEDSGPERQGESSCLPTAPATDSSNQPTTSRLSRISPVLAPSSPSSFSSSSSSAMEKSSSSSSSSSWEATSDDDRVFVSSAVRSCVVDRHQQPSTSQRRHRRHQWAVR